MNDASTVDLMIDRLYTQWKELAPGMRKTHEEASIQAMQKICRTFQLFMADFKGKVPAEAFETEAPRLREAFSFGGLDDCLKKVAETEPALDCALSVDFKSVLDRQESEIMLAAAKKRKELQKQLETATYMSLVEQLKLDREMLFQFVDKLKAARKHWSQTVQAYKRDRKNQGLERIGQILQSACSIELLESPGGTGAISDIARHFSVFKQGSAKAFDALAPENGHTLVILDFGTSPTQTEMIWQIKAAENIAYQHQNNAVLVRYPVRFAGQTTPSHLNYIRKMEDKLVASGFNIDKTLYINYDITASHARDGRDPCQQMRLCLADAFADSSPWLQDSMIGDKGRIDGVHLLPFKDMKLVPHDDPTLAKENLSNSERAGQLGSKAASQILQALIGRSAQNTNRQLKLHVVDLSVGVGDWLQACWEQHVAWLQGADVPCVVYMGCYPSSERSTHAAMKSKATGTLLSWWMTTPEAGDDEPSGNFSDAVQKPELKLLSWKGSEVQFPTLVRDKFEETEFETKWKEQCEESDSVIQLLTQTNTRHDDSLVEVPNNAPVRLTGPEMCSEDQNPSAAEIFDLDGTPLNEFDMNLVMFKIKATKHVPAVLITKNMDIFICSDPEVHGEEGLVFGPGELFGFYTGNIVVGDRDELISFLVRRCKVFDSFEYQCFLCISNLKAF